MNSTKLTALLTSLNLGELEDLRRFVNSPYYNSDPDLARLLDVLLLHHPDFSSADLTRKSIFKQLFPHEPFDDKRLRYLFSWLNKLAERFLALQTLERKPEILKIAQIEACSRRGLDKSYRQISKTLERDLEVGTMDSGRYYLANYQFAELRQEHFERQRIRRFDNNIQVAASHLDAYYFFQRLRLSCAMLDRQQILEAPYELHLSDSWFQHLEQNDFFNQPVIRVYAQIYNLLLEEDREEEFIKVKSDIHELRPTLPKGDLRDIYLFAINYCARKIRQGKISYLEEARQLYKSGIEHHILIENGQLSPWAFTNMVKLSLRLQQFDEIESFIETYSPLLPQDFREDALQYNLAELYYSTGRVGLAQKCLLNVAFTDLNYYLGARVMLVKIYYETGEEEALLSLLSSFMVFLKRNKTISAAIKHTYLNFCKILFRIVRAKSTDLKLAIQQISNTELLAEREWLRRACEGVLTGRPEGRAS